jgi:hypothetical protein
MIVEIGVDQGNQKRLEKLQGCQKEWRMDQTQIQDIILKQTVNIKKIFQNFSVTLKYISKQVNFRSPRKI